MIVLIFWIMLLALFAEILATMTGFGSLTIFLPIMLLFFESKTAIVHVAIDNVSGNIGRISFFRYGFDKWLLLIFVFPSVIFTVTRNLSMREAKNRKC